ncbi:MAG TPA: sigma-E factor regulatory protein RseB domain-containing protein [Chthonomonadales bacterium]|nr:sigma-E factor regulatory protein RseB domain-containing protein [Chthonomonadales bacterium]
MLLLRYLREGLRRPFVAHETTRLLQGQVRESQQIVKQAGLGAMRVEYQSPPAMRGEVLLILGRRMLRYVPAEGVVHESRAPETGVLGRAGALVEGLRSGAVRARVVGREEVAGRNAAIVEVRGAGREGFFKRLWIDTQSGVRMKIEDVDPSGVVVSTSYFTRIDLDPVLDAGEFRPGSLSRREARPRPLRTRPLASVAEAQQRVGYAIREPSLPPGYRLVGVWVAPAPVGRQAVILRYTDGVSTFTLSQHPAPARWGSRGADQAPRPRDDRGAIRWVSGGRVFILVGNLSPHAVDRIIASLR